MPGSKNKIAKDKDTTNTIQYDIEGIVLITIGILIIVSIFYSGSSGILGSFIRKLLITTFGIGNYIFPFILIFVGICFISNRGKINFSKRFYGIILFILSTLLIVQMINMDKYYDKSNIFNGIINIYSSKSVFHGGILGYLIDVPLFKLFGSAGCYVIIASLYFISLLLIFQVSMRDIFSKSSKSKIKEESETKKIIPDNSNNNTEKNNFIKDLNNKIKIIDFMKDNNADVKNDTDDTNDKNDANDEINLQLEKEIEQSSNKSNFEYQFPSYELLKNNITNKMNKEDKKDLINSANKLEETLNSFGVDAKVLQVTKGPSVTRYEIQPSAGVKVSKIVNLSDDIALSLASADVRIEAPIPGKSAVGIEIPNKILTPVFLREVIESQEFMSSNGKIAFCLGKDIAGKCVVADLTKMPHLLIAGATGSGKSVCINSLIVSILYKYSPEDVKLLLIDPKMVELNIYNGIPHLLIPVVTDAKKSAGALNWAVNEMTKRYKMFADNSVRNIESYNALYSKGRIKDKLPLIVIIIDELADLMMASPNDVENYICRLAQMARAAGMHLVIATQRPSVDVITGVIKANIPSRISFSVSSQIDSRTILDTSGAEKLLGKGDMLFYPIGENKPVRIQGAFISEGEVEKVVTFIKNQKNEDEGKQYEKEIIDEIDSSTESEDNFDDNLIDEAINIVVESDQASTSLLQRRLRIGYNRAARLMEEMEQRGIISKRNGSKKREILVSKSDIENK